MSRLSDGVEGRRLFDATVAKLQTTEDPVERQKIIDEDIAAMQILIREDNFERGMRFLNRCLDEPEIAKVFAKVGVAGQAV